MKRLTLAVSVVVVLALVTCSVVQAQGRRGVGAPTTAPRGFVGPAGPGPQGGPRGMQPGMRRRPAGIQHLFRVALLAAWAKDDAELQELVDKAIADRAKMIKSEEKHLDAFEDLVKAIRSEDEEEIAAKKEAFKTAREELKAAAEVLRNDIKAIVERLREIRPEPPEGFEAGEGARLRDAGGRRRRPARMRQPPDDDDIPLDIY